MRTKDQAICLYCQNLIVYGNDYTCADDDQPINCNEIDLEHYCGKFESINF